MPVYQYRDMREGGIVELVRSVANRDRVPPYFKRITVPVRLAVTGTSTNPRDPQSADVSVPRALKSLSGDRVNAMIKESGFSADTFRKAWDL